MYMAAVQRMIGNASEASTALQSPNKFPGDSNLAMMIACGWDLLNHGQIDAALEKANNVLEVDDLVSHTTASVG